MVNYRSVLAMILALITAFMLNVHSVAAAKVKKPLTYTSDQLEQIKNYATDLQQMRNRMAELGSLIDKKDWIFTRNFIHGPLGELRISMLNVARTLLPDAQPGAKKLAKNVFDDLVAIDLAAQNQNFQLATRKYNETLKDFDAFLGLIPPAARPESASAA
ncbi:photosystem II protein PsbQ [Leptolyngbyaceae cyanobacterium JSC-12]|nr:photosystem II protein PsbQ [Leptolyngbyaceae cyanobacterium JSC-12]